MRTKQFSTNAEKQKAYRERKRNADSSKRNADLKRIDELYEDAIKAVRLLAEYCNEDMQTSVESIRANFSLKFIASACWDAESGSLYRQRTAAGMWTQTKLYPDKPR